MRVLVTGGAGFIGAAVVDELLVDDHEVVVLDERPVHRAGVRSVVGDIRDVASWSRCVEGVQSVCHLAARVGLGVDFGDVEGYVSANDGGTAAGLLALHRTGFEGRLVLASSMVVYGEGAGECPDHGVVRPGMRRRTDLDAGRYERPCPRCGVELRLVAVDEKWPVDPRNVYAATKLHQEHLCAAYGRETGAEVVALRYHNVYGPGLPRDTPYAGVASLFLSSLRRGERPTVLEDGGQLRDFVHVSDVARATAGAATSGRAVHGAFNIASGQPRTVGELADALADAVGPSAPRPQVVGGYRLGDVRHVVASPVLAREVLGFSAAVPFEAGLASLVGPDLSPARAG